MRLLRRRGLVTPEPRKRPRSSIIRFEAELPNQLWQTDATHWALAGGGSAVEILNYLDDHSRLCLGSVPHPTVKAADVVVDFHQAAARAGYPAALLSDNGAVFSGASRNGKVLLESELERLGIAGKHARPYHPQTCGKVERFHQTQKRWLAKQPPAATLAELQSQLDRFRLHYNQHRPHRALGRRTPQEVFDAKVKAGRGPRCRRCTSGCATTPWTGTAGSPCAMTRGCTTSASAAAPRHADRAVRRRPRRPDRDRGRGAAAGAHPRSDARLPAAVGLMSTMSRDIVSDVATHHALARMGFEPMTSSLKGKSGSKWSVSSSPRRTNQIWRGR